MGPSASPNYSAIGDCVLVVSEEVVQQAKADMGGVASQQINLRGKQQRCAHSW
jgi:hypothetical protein